MTAGKFSFILLLPILGVACNQTGKITKTEMKEYSFNDSANATIDSSIEKVISPFRAGMSGTMNEVIATSDTQLTKGQPESLLGNFVSDVCFEVGNENYYTSTYTRADFAFFNGGGLRADLPKGKITRGNVFELMPFENELVVVPLSGSEIKKVFEIIASRDGAPVSNVRFKIKNKEPLEIMINGVLLDTSKNYKVITSDYLANGGDQFFLLAEKKKEYLNLKIRDVIIQYMQEETKEGKAITAIRDQRISYVK